MERESIRNFINLLSFIVIISMMAFGPAIFKVFSNLSWPGFLKGILFSFVLVISLLAFYRITRKVLIWIKLFIYVVWLKTKESIRRHIKTKRLLVTFNKAFPPKTTPVIYSEITKKFGYPDKHALVYLKHLSMRGDADALNQLGGTFADDYSYGYTESFLDFFPRLLKEPVHTFIQRRNLRQAKRSYDYEFVGRCYLYGDGAPKDSIQAIKYYRLASGNGSVSATYMIGHIYRCGIGIPSNEKEAIIWLKKAANGIDANGHEVSTNLFNNNLHMSNAQSDLGIRYFSGDGVVQDFNNAALWLHKAAKFGNRYAQYHLGLIYAEGLGKDIDDDEALSWFSKAAAQGHQEAQIRLGIVTGTFPKPHINPLI